MHFSVDIPFCDFYVLLQELLLFYDLWTPISIKKDVFIQIFFS